MGQPSINSPQQYNNLEVSVLFPEPMTTPHYCWSKFIFPICTGVLVYHLICNKYPGCLASLQLTTNTDTIDSLYGLISESLSGRLQWLGHKDRINRVWSADDCVEYSASTLSCHTYWVCNHWSGHAGVCNTHHNIYHKNRRFNVCILGSLESMVHGTETYNQICVTWWLVLRCAVCAEWNHQSLQWFCQSCLQWTLIYLAIKAKCYGLPFA